MGILGLALVPLEHRLERPLFLFLYRAALLAQV
jgi:hypothetical protein